MGAACQVDLTDFEVFLNVHCKLDKETTVPGHIKGFQMLAQCFEITNGETSFLGFMLALIQPGVMQILSGTELWGNTKSFGLKMRWALRLAVQHVDLTCCIASTPAHKAAQEKIVVFEKGILAELKKLEQRKRQELFHDTTNRLSAKLEKVIDVSKWCKVAETAMMDLVILVHGLLSMKRPLLAKERFVANALMWGILTYSAHLGRSKEWIWMGLDHVRDQVRAGKEYLESTKHKTFGALGSCGKWLPLAAWRAVKEFLKLPYNLEGRDYALFFENPHVTREWCDAAAPPEKHPVVSCTSMVRAFHRVYVQEEEGPTALGSQISRKWMTHHSQGHSDDSETCNRIVAGAQKHGLKVAGKHYATQVAKDHAKYVQVTTEGVFGEHLVKWPSRRAFEAHTKTTSATHVLQKWGATPEFQMTEEVSGE